MSEKAIRHIKERTKPKLKYFHGSTKAVLSFLVILLSTIINASIASAYAEIDMSNINIPSPQQASAGFSPRGDATRMGDWNLQEQNDQTEGPYTPWVRNDSYAPRLYYGGGRLAGTTNFTDMTGATSIGVVGDDTLSAEIPLGFTANYSTGAQSVTCIKASSNGFIYTGICGSLPTTSPYTPVSLASQTASSTSGMIAGVWSDLEVTAASQIKYKTFGTSPNRYFVVQYDVPQRGVASNIQSFQIKLFEASTADTTAPSIPTLTYTNGYRTSGNETISWTAAADAQSGINRYELYEWKAPLANNACSTYVKTATPIYKGINTSYTQTPTSGYCYKYELLSYNEANLSSTTGSSPTSVMKVDTSAPNLTLSYTNGYTNVLNAAITQSATDPETGINNSGVYYKRATLSNGSCLNWDGTWSSIASPYTMVDGYCYIFALYAQNNAGTGVWNNLSPTDVTKVDKTAPSTPGVMTMDGINPWAGNHYISATPTTIKVNTTGSSDTVSGIRGYRLMRSGDNNPACTTWTSIPESSSPTATLGSTDLPSNGTYRYYCWYAFDNAGNQSASSTSEYLWMDSSTPVSTVSITNNYYSPSTFNHTSTISGTSTDVGSGVSGTIITIRDNSNNYTWMGSGWYAGVMSVSPTTFTAPNWYYTIDDTNFTSGRTYTVSSSAYDVAGNSSSTNTDSFIYDSVPPVCGTWSPLSSPWHNSGGQSFTLSSSTDALSGISTAGGTCTTAATNGTTCTVAITDVAGNSTTCTSPVNNLDATAPTFTINDGASATAVQSDTITVTASDAGGSGVGATTYYTLSADNVCNASDTFSLTGTSLTYNTEANNGKYVCFRNTDGAGNIGYSSALGPLMIDITAPTGAPSCTASGYFSSTQSVTCTVGTGGTQIRYTTDGSSPTAASAIWSNQSFSTTTTLKTISCDVANNCYVGAGISTYTYTKDATAPTFTINDGASATAVQSDTITVTASDAGGSGVGATTYYTLSADNVCNASDTFSSTGSSITYNTEANNGKYVCFRNTDGAGNIGYSSALGPLMIDITAPTGAPSCTASGYFSSTQSVTCTVGTGGTQIRYTTDGSSPTAASAIWSNQSFSTTTTLKTISCDVANNCYVGAGISTNIYTLDNTAPTRDSLTVSNNWWKIDGSTTQTLTLKSTETGSGFGGPYGMMALINYQGSNSTNNRGYFAWHPTTYVHTLDQIACTGGGFASKNSSYGSQFITLTGCSTSTVGNQRTVVFTVKPLVTFGDFSQINDISFYTTDTLGNIGGWDNFDVNFGTDGTSPICGTWSPLSSPWHNSGGQSFTLSGSTDATSGIGTAGGSCTTAATNGTTCTVAITDVAGNSNTCTSPVNNLDTVAPTAKTPTIYSGTSYNNQYFKGTISIRSAISDTGGSGLVTGGACQVNINNAGWDGRGVSQDANYCYYNNYTPDADFNIQFRVPDNAGSYGTSSTQSFTYDVTAPTLANKTIFSTDWYTTDQISTFTYSDSGSGIASGNNPSCTISTEGTSSTCNVTPNVCDNLNNCNTTIVTSNSIKLDKTGSNVALTYSPANPKAGNVTITATYNELVKTGETPTISINQPGTTDISNANMTVGANRGIWTYNYTVQPSNGTTYLDGTATVSLSTTHDEAGNANLAPTNATFIIDTTSPTGNITYPTQYITNLSTDPAMTIENIVETGSGENIATRKLQRARATLSNNICGTYGSFTDTSFSGTYPNVTDTNDILNGYCYKYQWLTTDNAGNTGTFSNANEYKVDTTVPETNISNITSSSSNIFYNTGSKTLFYKTPLSSQDFTVIATASDAESGIWKVIFPGISTTGFSPTILTDDLISPFQNTYSIGTNATTSPGVNTVTGTNNANLTKTDNFTITNDSASPTGATVSCPSTYNTTGSFNVTGNSGTDNGASGVDTANVYIQRRNGTLTADNCNSFGAYSNQGTANSTNLAEANLATGCYEYQYFTKDLVGNSATSTSCLIKVDRNKPATTVTIANSTYSPSTFINSDTINGTASDTEGNISNVEITIYNGTSYWTGTTWGTSTWLPVTSGTTTWKYTLDQTKLTDGLTYTITARATDTAGNITSSMSTDSFVYDSTAPTITITNPNSNPAKSKTITASANDGTLTMFINSPGESMCHGALTFEAYSSKTFSAQSDNNRTICYRAMDAWGNTAYLISNAITGIDTTPPTSPSAVTLTPPNFSPNYVTTPTFTISGVASGDTINIFDNTCTTSLGSTVASGTTVDITTTALGQGSYTIKANSTDPAGNVSTCSTASANYSVDLLSPTIASATPNWSTTAGSSILLTGGHFYPTTTVTVGGNNCSNVTIITPSTLTCSAPANSTSSPANAVDISINTPNGSVTGTKLFTYYSTPTISTISPNSGALAGGTNVTITGTNFRTKTADSFTKLLLHADGANNSTTITDSGINPKTITTFGDAKISTTQNKFGGSSLSLDGTGDYLTVPNSTDFAYGTGDFTWDMWFNSNTFASGNNYLLDHGANGGVISYNGNILRYYNPTIGTGSILYTTGFGSNLSTGTWYHIAAVRHNGTTNLYLNGTLSASATDSHNYTAQQLYIGEYGGGGSYYFNGYIDELHISKGLARWTSNFTPPDNAYYQSKVTIGGNPATNLQVVDSNTITATTTANSVGATDVIITTPWPDNQTATITKGFTYVSPPTITGVTSSLADGNYKSGQLIPIQVSFDKAVTVSGTPQLALNSGSTANYVSGSETTTLTFNYIVSDGNSSSDLDYTNTNSLILNGGTILDSYNQAATLTLATPGAVGSLGESKAILIDTTAPTTTVSIASSSYSPSTFAPHTDIINGTATDGVGISSVEITIQRSSDSQYLISDNNWSSTPTWLPATTGTTSWKYTIDDETAPLTNGVTYTVTARATDAAGNITSTGFGTDSFTFDSTGPDITINNPDTNPANSKTITANVSEGTLTMFVNNAGTNTCNGTLSFESYSSKTFATEADNTRTVCYKAVDVLGNVSYLLSNVINGIDVTNPTITANNSSTSWVASSPLITLSTSDIGGSGLNYSKYIWDQSEAICRSTGTAFTNDNTISIPSEGEHTLYLCNEDLAGNQRNWNGPYKLDTTAPTGGSITYPDGYRTTAIIPITINRGTDFLSNLSNTDSDYKLEFNQAPLSANKCGTYSGWTVASSVTILATATSYNFTGTSNQCYQFRYTVKDTVGNSVIYTGTDITRIDATAPTQPSMVAEPTYTSGSTNTVSSTIASDSGVGGVEYNFCLNTSNKTSGCTASGWQSANSFEFTGLSSGQIYYYFVQARDTLLNTTDWSSPTNSTQESATPTITGISPNHGLVNSTVYINGTDFISGATVKFDTSVATISSFSSTQLKVTAPSHTNGPAIITVTNPDGKTATSSFTYDATYSTPYALYNSSWQNPTGYSAVGIESVSLNGENINLSNATSSPITPSYNYYSYSNKPDLVPGKTYTLNVYAKYTDHQHVKAWIDYNNNGTFIDSGEIIGYNADASTNSGNISFTFTVPSNATTGIKRLRIATDYYEIPYDSGLPDNGNNNVYYGEFEDYDVQLFIPALSAPQNLSVIGKSGNDGVVLNWDSPNTDGGYPISSYVIQYAIDTNNTCTVTTYGSSSCSSKTVTPTTNPQATIIDGLSIDHTYRFAAFAINSNNTISPVSNNLEYLFLGPPPTVSSISLTSGSNTETVNNVIINGSNFFTSPASTAELTKGSKTIPCSISNQTTTTITCTFDLNNAEAGKWNTKVTNYDGQSAILSNSFTITVGPMTLSNLSPTHVSTAGGNEVTISGTNFTPLYYETPVQINNWGSEITNQQISFNLDTSSKIAEGKMRNDCADIRVLSEDQTTELPFWIEGPCDSNNTIIWTKVPVITSSNTKTTVINITYGNTNLTSSTSNASLTFQGLISSVNANYTMDEKTGTTAVEDHTGNKYHATSNSTSNIATGHSGNARTFDSSQYIEIPSTHSDKFDLTNQISIESWVRADGFSAYNSNPRIFSHIQCNSEKTPINGYELAIGSNYGNNIVANRPYLELVNNGNVRFVTTTNENKITSNSLWHHVVATYDSTNAQAKIYLDGQNVTDQISNTANVSNAIGTPGTIVSRLASSSCGTQFLTGALDETRIYNKVLTEEEVALLYNSNTYTSPNIANTVLIQQKSNSELNLNQTSEIGGGIKVSISGGPETKEVLAKYIDQNTIYFTTPSYPIGTQNVTVTNGNNDTLSLPGSLTFVEKHLNFKSINNGLPIKVNEPFSITIEAVESDNSTPVSVSENTYLDLGIQTGTGHFINPPNTSTIFIPKGSSEVTIDNLSYSTIESGVIFSTKDITDSGSHFKLNSALSPATNIIPSLAADAAYSSVTVTPASGTSLANNSSLISVTVNLKASAKDLAHDKVVQLYSSDNLDLQKLRNIVAVNCQTSDNGLYTPGTTNANGDACFNVSSSYVTSGQLFIRDITDFGNTNFLTTPITYTFTGPAAANSTLTSSKTNALANNQSSVIFTATIKDAAGNLFPERPVSLQRTDSNNGKTNITPIICPNENGTAGISNSLGHVCFSVTSPNPQTYSFKAYLNRTTTGGYEEIFNFPTTALSVSFGNGLVWGAQGTPIANGANDNTKYYDQKNSRIISTSDGGTIVTWMDDRNGDTVDTTKSDLTIFAQKYDNTGTPLWTANGIPLYNATNDVLSSVGDIHSLNLVADEQGGAIITWIQGTTSQWNGGIIAHLRGQRLSATGQKLWGTTHLDFANIASTEDQGTKKYDIVKDGNSGFYVLYRDLDRIKSTYVAGEDNTQYLLIVNHYNSDGSADTTHNWPYQVNEGNKLCYKDVPGQISFDNYTNNLHLAIDDSTTSTTCNDSSREMIISVKTLDQSGNVVNQLLNHSIDTNNSDSETVNSNNSCNTESKGKTIPKVPYRQFNPIILGDQAGGAYLIFAEECRASEWTSSVPIFAAHLPSSSAIRSTVSRPFVIGYCPNGLNCGQANIEYQAYTENGHLFTAFRDEGPDHQNPLTNLNVQKYGHVLNLLNDSDFDTDTIVPLWDSNSTTSNLHEPITITNNNKAVIKILPNTADGMNMVWGINNYSDLDYYNRYGRLFAMQLDQDGNPLINQNNTGLWPLTGLQVTNNPIPSQFNENYKTPYINEGLLDQEIYTLDNYYFDNNLATTDGAGGMIIKWKENSIPFFKNIKNSLFLQRITSSATKQFNSGNSLPLTNDLSVQQLQEVDQSQLQKVSVEKNNTVYVWTDNVNEDSFDAVSNPDGTRIHAEKFDENGIAQWNNNGNGRSYGVTVIDNYCGQYSSSSSCSGPKITAETNNNIVTGNTYIGYKYNDQPGFNKQFKAQKINQSGKGVWSQSISISSDTTLSSYDIINDNFNGLYFAYSTGSNSNYNIHLGRIDDQGNINEWNPTDGTTVYSSLNSINNLKFLKLNNEYFLTWKENQSGTNNYYISKFSSVTHTFVSEKIGLNPISNPDYFDINTDENTNNLFSVYIDINTDTAATNSLMIQKYNSNLEKQWLTATDKKIYSTKNGTTLKNPKIISDQEGGAIITWDEGQATDSSRTVKYLRVDSNGNQIWNTKSANTGSGTAPAIATNGHHGLLLGWVKYLSATATDLIFNDITNNIDQMPFNQINNTFSTGGNNTVDSLVSDNNNGGQILWYKKAAGQTTNDIFGQMFVQSRHSYNSALSATPLSLNANNTDLSKVTASLVDENDLPLANKQLKLQVIGGNAFNGNTEDTNINYLNGQTLTTDSEGKAEWTISSNNPGTYIFAAYNITDTNTVIDSPVQITFNDLPVSETLSTINITPAKTPNDGVTPANISIKLKTTANLPAVNRTVNLMNNGTDIVLTAVECSSGGTAGTSNLIGEICYNGTSTTAQTAQISTEVMPDLVNLSSQGDITFALPTADPASSTFTADNTFINGSWKEYADGEMAAKYYSVYQSALLRLHIADNTSKHSPLASVPVSISKTETTGNGNHRFLTQHVNCDNPRASIANNLTDDNGNICFVATFDDPDNYYGSSTLTATADTEIVLPQTVTLTTLKFPLASIKHYQFRNDDGDENTSTSLENIDTPYYNSDTSKNFRLRFSVSRDESRPEPIGIAQFDKNKDTFDKKSELPIGPTATNITLASNTFAVQENPESTTQNIYVPVIINETNTRIYHYTAKADLLTFQDQFDITTTQSYRLFSSAVDQEAQNLYLVMSCDLYCSASNPPAVLKVNLSNHTVSTLNLSNYNAGIYTASFDFSDNLAYLGLYNNDNSRGVIEKVDLTNLTSSGSTLLSSESSDYPVSTVMDYNNKYLYVASTNKKIYKMDLDVDRTLSPVKVNTLDLGNKEPNKGSAVLDNINNYAYLSVRESTSEDRNGASIIKVDTDPNRTFAIVSSLKMTANDTDFKGVSNFSNYGNNNAGIDVKNQYAYFTATKVQTIPEVKQSYIPKIIRIDLKDFTHDLTYDELNYGADMELKALIYSPLLGQVYSIHSSNDMTHDVLDSAGGTNYLHYSTAIQNPDSSIQDLSVSSAFELPDTTIYNDQVKTTNQLGRPNQYFAPGNYTLKKPYSATTFFRLGRNEFTEIETAFKFKANQTGQHLITLNGQFAGTQHGDGIGTILSEGPWAPTSIGGVKISKKAVNIIEGTTKDTYQVSLLTEPTAPVNIVINSSEPNLTITPATITFNNGAGWDTPQTVTVSMANDQVISGTRNYQINHSAISSDANYNNTLIRPLEANVTDYGATTTNIKATVSGDISFTSHDNFNFPNVFINTTTGNFSPTLTTSITESRGTAADFTLTLQTSSFCIPTTTNCIPLDKVYVATSDLINSFNTFSTDQIRSFLTNYLDAANITNEASYRNPSFSLNNIITLFDSRNVPSGSSNNPLQGAISFATHLMIDYANISGLNIGSYVTTLTYTLNKNP